MNGGTEKRERGKGHWASKGWEEGEKVLHSEKVRRKGLLELRETDLTDTVE